MDAYDLDALAKIDRLGWIVQGVFPDPEEGLTTFSYTSGLSMFDDHPELVVTGIHPQTSCTLLNSLGELVREGRRLVAGDQVEQILANYPVRLVEADPEREDYPMSMARRFYPECTALQMLWPDKQGAFPDSPDYTLSAASQPLLPLSR